MTTSCDRRTAPGAGGALRRPLLAGLALLAVACQQQPEASHSPGAVEDQVAFIDALRAREFRVEILGNVEQPFLAAAGTRVEVSGPGLEEPAELQLFQYESPGAAADDAGSLGPGGAPAGVHVNWMGPPHFFRAGRLLALYVGADPGVLNLLRELLGEEVAGAGEG